MSDAPRPPLDRAAAPVGPDVGWRRPDHGRGAPLTYRPRPAASTAMVATLLTPPEQRRLEAAGTGRFVAVHAAEVGELAGVVRRGAVAVVASTAALDAAPVGGTAAVVQVGAVARAVPTVPVLVLVSDPAPPALLVALGRHRVERLVDLRRPDGWARLCTALSPLVDGGGEGEVRRLAAEVLAAVLPAEAARFVLALFELPPAVTTVRQLAGRLGVPPTTLTSRFLRAGLPAPKRYLAMARLVRAARLLESRRCSLARVADALEYSSAQSFGRHLHALLGVGAAEFRSRHDARSMMALFCQDLVVGRAERLQAIAVEGRLW